MIIGKRKQFLIIAFLVLNFIAICAAFKLWNESSMAAGVGLLLVWGAGGLGSFIGGFLSSQKFYQRSVSHWTFGAVAAVVVIILTRCANYIVHPSIAGGQLPTSPWHENGIVWLYLIISSLWMLVQSTRTK